MAISFAPDYIGPRSLTRGPIDFADITVNHETKVIALRSNDPVMAARINKALSIPKAWTPK